MTVIGANLGETAFGKPLKDGSLCVLRTNSRPLVYVEERITGEKHRGGFKECWNSYQKSSHFQKPILVALSSCCEQELSDLAQYREMFGCEVVYVNHHRSHALQVSRSSTYASALVMIADAGGNVLTPVVSGSLTEWWRHPREQVSFFIYDRSKLELIERYYSDPYDIGYGEFWRYITYLCGFRSSNDASKVMELAAFSKPVRRVNYFESRQSATRIDNSPNNKKLGELLLRQSIGYELDLSRFDNRSSVAAWAQFSLETDVLKNLRRLRRESGLRYLCIAGGVGLNCKLVSEIRKEQIFDDVFVGYAPSDWGQAIGNAIAGAEYIGIGTSSRKWYNPLMLEERVVNQSKVIASLGDDSRRVIVEKKVGPSLVIDVIESGFIVGTCTSKGEVGARALGNTSILANPNAQDIKTKINSIKKRPDYTPVAPAFSKESFSRYFSTPNMNFAYMGELVWPHDKGENLPESVVHSDGSVRAQVVEEFAGGYLSKLVEARREAKGTAADFIVLNTSFNGRGKPMVSSADVAVRQFLDLGLDALVLNDDMLVRRKSAQFEALVSEKEPKGCEFLRVDDIRSHEADLRRKYGRVELRRSFSLFDNYVEWLKEGRKVTTIRFVEGGLTVPGSHEMPLIVTKDFRQTASFVQDYTVKVEGVLIKKFCELDNIDAQRDGFEKTSHLKGILKSIYPTIRDESFLSINFISLK